nr:ribonuclease H-like domain-containing protein [Tanacetum cinerariifolium]
MKAANYENIKWIEDLVPRTMWIQEPVEYDKHALWGVSHWGRKRQQLYSFAVNRESTLDVYSKRRIIAVTDLKIMEWHSYKHLDWITVGISHETSVARSSQQNGVVERRNHTLIEAAHTMLIYAQALLFLWAEGSYNQIFIGYAPTKKAFRIYNRRTRRIVETIHVNFDELTAMASEQSSSRPALNERTPATISLGLVPKPSSSTPYVPPSRNDWNLLFQPLFDELLTPPPSVDPPAPKVIAPIADVIPPVQAESTIAYMGNDPLFGVPIPEVASAQSSSMVSPHTIMQPDHQILQHNRATPPKTKARVRKTKSSSDATVTPPTAAAGTRLYTSAKGKQPAKASKAKSLTVLSEKSSDEEDDDDDQDEGDDDDDQEEGNDDDQDSDEEGEEFIHPRLSIHDDEETKDEESFDPIAKTPKNSDDEGNAEENLGLNVGREKGQDEEDDKDELYRDVNINLEGRVVQMADVHTTQEFEDSHVTLTLVNPDGQQQRSSMSSQFVTSMLNPTPDAGIDSIFKTTSQMEVQAPTIVAPLPLSAPTLTPSTIATISTVPQAPTPQTTAPSTLLYMDQRMNEAVKVAVQIQSDRLRDKAQAENDEFLKNLDENIQKIIKVQVKEQVKVQVSKILPKIKQTVNEQLEVEVLTRSSNSSKTSYAIAADLSEMELKKILIEKMEGNKEGKEPESTSAPKEKATRTTGKSTQGSKSRQTSTSESATAEEPLQTSHDLEKPLHPEFETGTADDQPIAETSQLLEWFSQQKKPPTLDRDWNKTLPATHISIQPWISELAKQTDSRSSFNELMDTPVDF